MANKASGLWSNSEPRIIPSVLCAKCSKNVLSEIGASIPARLALSFSSIARCTRGSSHCLIVRLALVILLLNNSATGQKYPSLARWVTTHCADSKACAKLPNSSFVALPLGPIFDFPGSGRLRDSVSKLDPKRNSDALSNVKRAYKSWASQGIPDAVIRWSKFRVRLVCFSKIWKSEIRSRAKNGLALTRC